MIGMGGGKIFFSRFGKEGVNLENMPLVNIEIYRFEEI